MSGLFGTVREGRHQDDNIIELPSHEANEHIKALINQLITWKPDTKNPTDLVMALWFCEIRAQEIMRQGRYSESHSTNRWASRRSLAQRQVINLDDPDGDYQSFYLIG